MRKGKIFFYGAASSETLDAIISMLPFEVLSWIYAAEHYGSGLRISAKGNRATEARRRNYTAALLCNALVVVGRPRFTASVVKAFVQRGRRIFWWNGKRLIERDGNEALYTAFKRCPTATVWEPDLWEQQRAEKMASMQEYLDAHPEKQRTLDEIPTFGWVEVFNEDEIECSDTDIFKRCRRAKLADAQ